LPDRHGCLSAADAMDGKEAALKNFVWPLLLAYKQLKNRLMSLSANNKTWC